MSGTEVITKLNETYALVLIGDKAAVLKEGIGSNGQPEFSLLSIAAFKSWLANRYVRKTGDEKKKAKTVAELWLGHSDRRQYEGIVFAPQADVPGYYNLWRGFAVEPRPGDCSKFVAHVKNNACCGNDEIFNWVMGWFAEIFQFPQRKSGTSVVIRGKMGTGKTKIGDVIGSLLGHHYVKVADPRYVVGRFNSHMTSCLLLHADEAFWAGDHEAEGKLKDLITGETHMIEFKGKEPVQVRNFIRLLVTGNPDWLVPAGMDERRFATFEINEEHKEDHSYFEAIDKEMDNGGREALLHYLLHFDLSKVNLRMIPKTAALLDQKIASLTHEQGWWLDLLQNGRLPWGCESPGECPTNALFEHYIRHAGKAGARRRSIETRLGIFLKKVVSKLQRLEATYQGQLGAQEEGYIYRFPPLDECREEFATALQHEFQWGDQFPYWTTEPEPRAATNGRAEDDRRDRVAGEDTAAQAAREGPPPGHPASWAAQ